MHVGKAGFAPLFRMRSSTSSATSSNNAPSLTRATARSRASREIRPARSNDSRTSASMRLRSRTNWTLPKDLGARTGEVHDRRFSAEQGRAAINVEVDSVTELLPCSFARARRRLTVPVRARRSDRAERLCEEAGDRMGWHAECDQAILRHDCLRRLGCRPQDDRVRTREVLRAERLADCSALPEAKDVPDIGDRNRDGQVPGSRLRRVELLDGPGLERIHGEAVYGVRRMNHEAAGPQDVADATQCRRVQEILRTQGQRDDRLDHPVADAEDRSRAAFDPRFLRHLPLDRLDDRLARLDVSGGNRPEAFRRAIRLADYEEIPVPDEERARTDRDREGRDVQGHGPGHASERDGFISGLVPRPPRWAMQRKVTFTPRRFLKKVWQLGNFDVSPDGRLLAFAANKGDQWSVYLLDLRTRKARTARHSDQSVLNPEFSPDGRWIAVQSDFEGDENYNIYLVPVRGAHVQKITDTPFDSAFPRWSPDGTKIAFLSNRDGDRDNVFVVDTSGGDAKQLTNVDDIVGEIAWRPDGRSIAFSAGVGLLDYVGLVDLAGHLENVVAFAESENALGGDLGRPEPWSPDGRELAFVSNVHDHLDIGVLSVKTKRVRFIVTNRWDKTMPLWAPDGKRIAFLENHDGNVQLKVVSRDGKGSRAISPAKGSANRALWAPDGKGLFYHHSTFTQPDRLILRNGPPATTRRAASEPSGWGSAATA